MFVGFQRRFFRLKDKKLFYYKDTTTKRHCGVINFDLVTVDLNSFDLLIELRPLGSKRRFVIAAQHRAELQDWVSALMLHISHSEGYELQLPAPTSADEWWRFDSITMRQFASMATTGDVLLFRSLTTMSSLARVFTNSCYDHIAMVLRFSSGRLALLESTFPSVKSMQGVNLLSWDEYVLDQHYLGSSRVTYRHLEVEFSDVILKSLESFVEGVQGMKYHLSAMKLLTKPNDDTEGYFCSQLVAAAYKTLGLITSEAPSSGFWPGDFSSERSLELQGAYLCEEQVIDFAWAQGF
jgi:hypothetical protein